MRFGRIIKCYYMEVRRIKRRLPVPDDASNELEVKLIYKTVSCRPYGAFQEEILATLRQIRQIIVEQHNGLFRHLVDSLMNKDLVLIAFPSSHRQESSVHPKSSLPSKRPDFAAANYESLTEAEKLMPLAMEGTVRRKETYPDRYNRYARDRDRP